VDCVGGVDEPSDFWTAVEPSREFPFSSIHSQKVSSGFLHNFSQSRFHVNDSIIVHCYGSKAVLNVNRFGSNIFESV
jgi:hypothetical protein